LVCKKYITVFLFYTFHKIKNDSNNAANNNAKKTIDMSELWGLVLFGTLMAIAASFALAIVYCSCMVGRYYCKKLQTAPLSTAENQV
jgi:hypothetical protein